MDTALTGQEMRTYAQDFEDLRAALRETYSADPATILAVRVDFDMAVITHAMGSVDLVLAALVEAFRFIAPRLVESSMVRVHVNPAGRRDW